MQRTMTLLNDDFGDLTLTWESDKDDEMREIIQKKMDDGVRFFIIKPFETDPVQIKKINDVASRTLIIKDEDIDKLFKSGKIGILKQIKSSVFEAIRPAKSAFEAAKESSVGVRQLKGG
jgi:hypothetical protein